MTQRPEPDTPLDGNSSELFHLEKHRISETRNRLAQFIVSTPLLRSKVLPEISFKTENLQMTGSFKIRPALSQIMQLSEGEKERGLVTSSSGNFAQGAAYAARCFGLSAKIVMMKSASPLKVQRTRSFGGEVVFCEDSFEARQRMVDEICAREGRTEIHPFDRVPVVLGNATIGAEILEQFPEVQNVVVPVSGGGLIAGVATALKLLQPKVSVYGVQPEGSNAAVLSYQRGRLVSIERAVTVADGLMVTKPGKLTFPLIHRFVDGLVAVREEALLEAVRFLLLEEKLVAEPSAAVTLAAVLEGQVPREKTVCILSGGNAGPELLGRALGG